ncbi:MAG TPA: efflux transporter outer membrane subunit [Burkholderiaceae bacterium]|nr:efflux transporter outer membrane subunit [Burkholderiaceae bacterium]
MNAGVLRQHAIVALLAAGVLAACSTAPADLRRAADAPAGWRTAAVTERALSDRPWGELFRSEDLDALIREALRNNTDLLIAVQQVQIARAQYGVTRSYLFPTFGAQFDYAKGRQSSGSTATPNVNVESASLGGVIPAWEIDLFGRLQAATESQRRLMLASEDTQWAVYISLIGAVSRGYLRLLDLDNQLVVAKQQVESRRESLRVVSARHKAGVSAGSDLRQAESNFAQAEAAVAEIEKARTQAENALAVLIGRNPGPIQRQSLADVGLPPQLPAGLPSQLLERRPDVLAAEQTVRASEANLDAAKRAYFPTISLTAFLGVASPALSALFDDGRGAWSVAPSVTAPIFTWGRLSSNVDAARAQQVIAVEQYRLTVRTAFREVDDALVAYERNVEQRAALDRAVKANRERARLAELRYRSGVTIYLEVLIAQQDVFESELRLSSTTRDVYESVVDLYVALGGGWQAPATAEAARATSGTAAR